MPSDRIIRPEADLPKQVGAFWNAQARDWPRLGEAAARLADVQTRDVPVSGRTVRLQHNPGRAVSVTAKVDAAAIAARPCFLCGDNLPPEQQALAVHDDLWLLCNPAPIFAPHFVAASTNHVPQRVADATGPLLTLARRLGPEYVVFYNGPRAGASAPDHLHLQAVPAERLPFLPAVHASAEEAAWRGTGGAETGCCADPAWPTVMFRGTAADLPDRIAAAVAGLGQVVSPDPEPSLNLFGQWTGSDWFAWFVPRQAHRPRRYGTEPGQVLVSPGAIEMAGVVVAPRAEDFADLTAADLAEIYTDVTLTPQAWATLAARLADL